MGNVGSVWVVVLNSTDDSVCAPLFVTTSLAVAKNMVRDRAGNRIEWFDIPDTEDAYDGIDWDALDLYIVKRLPVTD